MVNVYLRQYRSGNKKSSQFLHSDLFILWKVCQHRMNIGFDSEQINYRIRTNVLRVIKVCFNQSNVINFAPACIRSNTNARQFNSSKRLFVLVVAIRLFWSITSLWCFTIDSTALFTLPFHAFSLQSRIFRRYFWLYVRR